LCAVLFPAHPRTAQALLDQGRACRLGHARTDPGTPDAIVQKIHGAVIEALKMPDVQQKYLAVGGEVVGNSPKELADFLAAERVRWKKVIETANVTVD
jgi:tripartite-type tricarboxylate transporter receptor subunit TctC